MHPTGLARLQTSLKLCEARLQMQRTKGLGFSEAAAVPSKSIAKMLTGNQGIL
jgi:hypothetical protein